ncbi:MAG TPA: hypothetical protein VGA56_26065 [Opitutaceae bacterium]
MRKPGAAYQLGPAHRPALELVDTFREAGEERPHHPVGLLAWRQCVFGKMAWIGRKVHLAQALPARTPLRTQIEDLPAIGADNLEAFPLDPVDEGLQLD